MTGTEKLTERIFEIANSRKDANLEQAQKEAAVLLDSARKEAESKKHEILEKAAIEANEKKERLTSVAKLEARKVILNAKQEMIEEVFLQAVEKLKSLPQDEYRQLIQNMIIYMIDSVDGEIILSENDKNRIGDGLSDSINKRLNEMGVKGRVKLSELSRNIDSGFILKFGDIEINSSFEAIVKSLRDELEPEVVKALFGD